LLSGVFAALFGVCFKLINCYIRFSFVQGHKRKITYLLSAAVSAYILACLCFSKPQIKILMHFALALAFECLFKLMFAKSENAPNRFYTDYVQVTDPDTGEKINRYVTPEMRKKVQKMDMSQKYMKQIYNRRNVSIRMAEMVVAAFLSVALHYLAYEFGDKYDNMDMSQHESHIHSMMRRRNQSYSEDELDYINYFYRKIFYHLMSRPGEDNFRSLIFKPTE
jgi:hypothetical protein